MKELLSEWRKYITEASFSGNQLERRDETVKAILKMLGLDSNKETDKATYQYTYALRAVAQGRDTDERVQAMLADKRFEKSTGLFMKL